MRDPGRPPKDDSPAPPPCSSLSNKGEAKSYGRLRKVIARGRLGQHGGDRSNQGTNIKKDGTLVRGNTRPYTLSRLDRDRPDLAAKVDVPNAFPTTPAPLPE
jgi:hypothetical protein